MRTLFSILAVFTALLAAAPAAAQSARVPQRGPSSYAVAYGGNTLRLGLGAENFSIRDCVEVNGDIFCDERVFFRRSNLVLGLDYDLSMGGGSNLTFGARLSPEPFVDGAFGFEPSVGYTYKFLGLRAPVVPRLHAGVGVHLDGQGAGPALRLGGGVAFFPAGHVGIGVDLMVEAGSYRGFGFSGTQLMIGPEFRM
jgi:hypothetical protein